jgi:hypothetical protein
MTFMPSVTRIQCDFWTGQKPGHSTDGWIFLGIGGREFLLDTSGDDFQGGHETFNLGVHSNVLNGGSNDPRVGKPLTLENIHEFPRYIRFEGNDKNDNWNLDRAAVAIFTEGNDSDQSTPAAFCTTPEMSGFWLGRRTGNIVYMNPIEVPYIGKAWAELAARRNR